MKDQHILDIIDNGLNEADLISVKAHTAYCESCRQALEASQIFSRLLRNAEVFEPSAFFQNKVLNALQRERQNIQNIKKPIAAFWRWWQASSSVVALMVVVVLSLIALTFLAPSTNANQSQIGMSSDTLYSTEAVLLDKKMRNDLTTEQTLEIIYETKK